MMWPPPPDGGAAAPCHVRQQRTATPCVPLRLLLLLHALLAAYLLPGALCVVRVARRAVCHGQ